MISRPIIRVPAIACWPLLITFLGSCGQIDITLVDSGVEGGSGRPALVFVTSGTIVPENTNLAQADAFCATSAADAGLPGTFVAWYADGVDPQSRLADFGGWVRPDGRVVATSHNDLVTLQMLHPIALTEHGEDVREARTLVATGTSNFSTVTQICGDGSLRAGFTAATGGRMFAHANVPCSEPYRLYCFETGVSVSVTPTQTEGRLLFLSSNTLTLGGGIAAADALCNNEAALANQSGTFVAVLATDTETASSRLTARPGAWVRPDGIQLATELGLPLGELITSPNVTLEGTYVALEQAWFGTRQISELSDVPDQTCENWTELRDGTAFAGHVDSSRTMSRTGGFVDCGSSRHVFCAEEP